MKVAVLGSGNGGTAVAFDFAYHGNDVFIYDFPDFTENISEISRAGGIESQGDLQGFAPIRYAGCELEKVLDGAEITFVVGPSFATKPFAKACKPFMKSGQTIIICPGSCGGSIIFKKALGEDLSSLKFLLAETHTLPYAVRLIKAGKIHVFNKLKGGIFLAGLPSSSGAEILKRVRSVYPGMSLAKNILQTFLQNANPVIHPAIVLMNSALIERTNGDFLFYEEGVTSAVGRVIKVVDEERVAIGRALGLEIIPNPEIGYLQGYQEKKNCDYETLYSKGKGFKGIGSPPTLNHRYLTEDVARSMVLLHGLAKKLGIETPVMDSIITITSIILKDNLFDYVDTKLDEIELKNKSLESFLKSIA